ncbi:MAG: hypothetical protein CMI02_02665 [Oceanospirillaceae bacterium]|nr:hypothetical protein [Oceanospirillaceae bacterium]MBT10922.1 hypothetical protein [Oceanospirillaceae bacterium]
MALKRHFFVGRKLPLLHENQNDRKPSIGYSMVHSEESMVNERRNGRLCQWQQFRGRFQEAEKRLMEE